MNLQILRQLTYISPSTYLTWTRCQFKIFLTRLAGHEFIKAPMSQAAALGIAFDAFIKDAIVRKLKLPENPVTKLDRMMAQIQLPEREAIIEQARYIARLYIEQKMLDRVLAYKDIRVEQELYLNHGGVPILGRLDAIVDNTPLDWKVRGFFSSYPTSPTKGYQYKISNKGEVDYYCGEKALHFLDIKHPEWAIQMLFYNWLLGKDKDVYEYIIHEVISQKTNIYFVEHKGSISLQFAKDVFKDVQLMWETCHMNFYTADINEPSPGPKICEAYNVLCEAAQLCKFYERWKTNA